VVDSRIGTVLDDRYQILDRIAAGGMGVVYKGERLKLGRSVAIKFLHAWMASDDSFIKRFEIEAKAMAKLQHPNCTSVIDFGIDGEEPYVVMDLVSGESLRKLLDREPVSVTRAIEIIRQVLSGLAHAHAQGITHRDIKPDNIMVDTSSSQFGDQVRILDFGLAKMRENSGLTAGFVVGTPAYMAPEQTMGNPVDERSDVYAVGVLLFEMLTGRKPFVADEAVEIIRMHRTEPPPRLAQVAPGASFSAALQAVVDRALAKEAGHRYQSAAEFAAALDTAPEAAQIRTTPAADARGQSVAAMGTAATAMLRSDALMPMSSPGMAMAAPGTVPTENLALAGLQQPMSAVSDLGPASSQQPISALQQMPPHQAGPQAGPQASPQASPQANIDVSHASAQMVTPDAYGSSALVSQAAYATSPAMQPSAVQPMDSRMPGTSGYAPVASGLPRSIITVVAAIAVLGLLVAVGVWASQGSSGSGAVTTAQLGGSADTGPVADQGSGTAQGTDQVTDQGTAQGAGKNQGSGKDQEKPRTGDTKDQAVAAGSGNSTAHPPPQGDGAEPAEFTRIKERIKAGNTRGATKELEKLKRRHTDNAEIPYVLGQLYFGMLWVNDGLEAFREAIHRDPVYRNNESLIKSTIIGLANDSHHTKVRRFLVREVGKPAVPFLEDAATNHNSPRIRERAQRALNEIR
jgi:eukaryotic-like serine/threonine-protein kinase